MRWLRFPHRVRRHPVILVGFAFVILSLAVGGRYLDRKSRWEQLQAYMKAKQWPAASPLSDFFESHWPDDPLVLRTAARVARNRGDLVGADRRLIRCLELEKQQGGASTETQLEFLLLRVQSGEADEVTPPLHQLVMENHPDSEMILETVARAYMQLARYNNAQSVLTVWAERFPKSAEPQFWLGWVAEGMNQFKVAKICYVRALELDPDYAQARKRLAEMYLVELQPTEARAQLAILLEHEPENLEYLARMGLALFQEGNFAEAEKRMVRVVDHLPQDPTPNTVLGKIAQSRGQFEAAEKYLKRAVAIDPFNSEARFTYASCLGDLGRTAESQKEFQLQRDNELMVAKANKLLEEEGLNPSDDPAKHSEIGTALLDSGRDQIGLYWLNRALTANPNLTAAHVRLAEYFAAKGDEVKAAAHRKAAGQ